MKNRDHYMPGFDWRFLLPRYWMTWLGLLLLWFLNFLPFKLKRSLSSFIGQKVYQQNVKRRNIVETNLAMAFPEKSQQEREQLALRFTINMIFILLDYPLLFWSSKQTLHKRIQFKGLENIASCQEKNQPVILLTCHMLALEYGALALTEKIKMAGLIKPARNKLFEWFIARGRMRFEGQAKLFLREKGIRPVIREIKKQRAFYYLPDEDLGEKAKTCFVPFFGVETATLTALAPMVKMTKAAVLPAVTILDEKTGCYLLEIEKPLEDFPGKDQLKNMERMNHILER
ncbi:MAG: hypothetical protein OEY78_10615, partial [Gammaproteobacteria bacterium]|nr:hypothetical protein [Gammaproteobacteria bacterium]